MDCTVPGCSIDLRSDSVISIRVLVCKKHRTAPTIEGGLAADGSKAVCRYCQQCGKVQDLSAFDGKRRSCRESLERHRIRRKESEKRKLAGNPSSSSFPRPSKAGRVSDTAASESQAAVSTCKVEASRCTPRSPGFQSAESSVGPEVSGQESFNCKVASPASVQTSQEEQSRSSGESPGTGVGLPWKIENDLRALDEMILSQQRPSSASEDPLSYSMAGNHNAIKVEPGSHGTWPYSNRNNDYHQGYSYQQSYYGDGPSRNGGYHQEGTDGMFSRGGMHSFYPQAPRLAASYLPADDFTYSTHMKIRNATPAHLPADLHDVMSFYHGGHPHLQGSIRPGCVHLAVDAWIDSKEQPGQREVSSNIAAGIARDVAARTPGRPWSHHDTDIFLHDKVLKIRNRGTSITSQNRDTAFSVKLESPVATADGCVSLAVSGLVDDIPFQVCARVNGHYYDLDVAEVNPGPQPGSSNCFALLPSGYVYGLAWIEVFQNLPDGSVRVSTASPMFISPQPELAEELSTLAVTPPGLPCPANVAAWFKDFGEVLYCEEPSFADAYARCLLRAASRGWHNTFAEILDLNEQDGITLNRILRAANPVGLLQLAVVSRSAETVKLVLDLLSAENMLFAVVEAGSAVDTSALHLAAEIACKETVDLLLGSCEDARAHWMGHVGGAHNKTPVDVFTLATGGRGLPALGEAGADAWGLSLVRQLQSLTGQAVVLSSASGVIALSLAGMIHAMYVLPALVLSFLALVVFPFVHELCYVSVLKNVRQMASPLGLSVTRGLRLEDPLAEAQYEKFANAEMIRPILVLAFDVARLVIHVVPPVQSAVGYFMHHRTIHVVHFPLLLIHIGMSLYSTVKARAVRRVNSWLALALHFPLLVIPAIKPWLLGQPVLWFPSAVQFENCGLSVLLLGVYSAIQMSINYVPVDILLWTQIHFVFQQELAFYLLMDSLELSGFHSPPWLKPVSWCCTVTAMTIVAALKVKSEGKRLIAFLKRTKPYAVKTD